jgi:hypothetical protein
MLGGRIVESGGAELAAELLAADLNNIVAHIWDTAFLHRLDLRMHRVPFLKPFGVFLSGGDWIRGFF